VRLQVVARLGLSLDVASDGRGQAVALLMDLEFAPSARYEPPLVALPAIFDRVLAEHGSYVIEPLGQGQRHAVRFVSRAR